MNREILFRGKRIDNNEWVYGGLIRTNFYYWIHIEEGIGKDSNLLTLKYCIAVIPETVGQYTERKDNKGNKIFENDIAYQHKLNNIEYGIIKYHNGEFTLNGSSICFVAEVISNKDDATQEQLKKWRLE